MKKIYLGATMLLLALGFNGCATVYSSGGTVAAFGVEKNASKSDVVRITAANRMSIWKIDGERKVGIINMMTSGGLKEVTLPAGEHKLGCALGRDIWIGAINYEAGHDYLVNYDIEESKIYYWVEDLTAKSVVYGKKR